MIEKFYYDILDQHLKEANKIKPYREELEKCSRDYQEYADMLFDKPFSRIYNEAPKEDAPKKPKIYLYDQYTTKKEEYHDKDPAGTIMIFTDGQSRVKNNDGKWSVNDFKIPKKDLKGLKTADQEALQNVYESAKEAKEKKGPGALGLKSTETNTLKNIATRFAETQIVAYAITDAINLFNEKNGNAEEFKSILDKPNGRKIFLKSLKEQSKLDPNPISVDNAKDDNLNTDAVKKSPVNQIITILTQRNEEFQNYFKKAKNEEKFITIVHTALTKFMEDLMARMDPVGTINLMFSSRESGVDASLQTKRIIDANLLEPKKKDAFIKIMNEVFSNFPIKAEEIGKEGEGDQVTLSSVVDVLNESGKLDQVLEGAHSALTPQIEALADKIASRADKVFAGKFIGEKPGTAQNEEAVMQLINDVVFKGEVSSKPIFDSKFYLEQIQETIAQDLQANKNTPTKETTPTSNLEPVPQKEEEKKVEPKELPKPNINERSTQHNRILKGVVGSIVASSIATFLAVFSEIFANEIKKETSTKEKQINEEYYLEGITSFILSGLGQTAGLIIDFVKDAKSTIPANIADLKDTSTFKTAAKEILNKMKSGKMSLDSLNASKQQTEFNSDVFNITTVNKYSQQFDGAIKKAANIASQAIGKQYNDTTIHQIIQQAYQSGMSKGEKLGYKARSFFGMDKIK